MLRTLLWLSLFQIRTMFDLLCTFCSFLHLDRIYICICIISPLDPTSTVIYPLDPYYLLLFTRWVLQAHVLNTLGTHKMFEGGVDVRVSQLHKMYAGKSITKAKRG
jgi:hypothetical protein